MWVYKGHGNPGLIREWEYRFLKVWVEGSFRGG